MSKNQGELKRRQRRVKALQAGWKIAAEHVVLAELSGGHRYDVPVGEGLGDAWAVTDLNGGITANQDQDGEPAEWAWVFAHLLLHLGLGHTRADRIAEARALQPGNTLDPVYLAACCAAVNRFSAMLRIGRPIAVLPELPETHELELTERWRTEGVPAEYFGCGTGGSHPCLEYAPPALDWHGVAWPLSRWEDKFAVGLVDATNAAMEEAAESRGQVVHKRALGAWDKALSWFVSSYPLLGAVAAGLTLVADPEISRAWDIGVAAVNVEYGEVYVNPHAGLSPEEWRFVLAHEMLHAALGHHRRADGREPYLWNVACDYVINGWLVTMAVGQMPEGCLYDPALVGLSAESVYDTLVTDLRRARKLLTFGGRKVGDVLGDWLSAPDAAVRRGSRRETAPGLPPTRTGAVELDGFYRRALSTGLEYHRAANRGLLPAGLEEEIRALDHPPLPWDAQLARWFDEHVRSPEPHRSFARPSRRQASTPDIPRPGRVQPDELDRQPTFGVVLDTSLSMDPVLLGKALGAIASYAAARDVPAARVVFCDAAAYDAGYLAVDDIVGRVKVRGRGGTVLQPGIRLLENAVDFPADGPILIITDGDCDVLRVRREHAYLIPAGSRLPFTAKGPVFRVR